MPKQHSRGNQRRLARARGTATNAAPGPEPEGPRPALSDPDGVVDGPAPERVHDGMAHELAHDGTAPERVHDGGSGPTGGHSVGSTVGTMFGRDSLYMVASSLNLLAGVMVTPLMTRVLGLHQYGIFAADLALLYVLYYTANLGLNIGIQRLFSQEDGERRSRNLLAASLVIVFTITAIVYLTGPLWSPHLGFGDFPLSTRLTTIWAGFFAMTWICLAVLRCHERLLVFATVCLMQSILGIGVGTLYAYFHDRLATEVLSVAIIVQVAAVVLSLTTITPHWRGIFDLQTVRTTLRFSIPIVPLQISTFVLSASDRFIILRDLGAGPTGRYQVAYTLGAVGISMLTFLNLAWLPRIFAIKDPHARAAVLAHSRDGLYRLLVPVTLGIALGGPIALRIWAPPSFRTEELIPVILLVVVSTIPVCTSFVHSRLMLAEGRSGVVAIVTVVAALTNIGLNLILVPHLGINGSALATTITYTLLAFGMACFSRLMLRLPRPPLWLWAQLAVTVAATFATRPISTHGTGALIRLLGVAIAAVAAFHILRRLQKSGAEEALEASAAE
jgi:O-antigen/teichoic acid export membrane protein